MTSVGAEDGLNTPEGRASVFIAYKREELPFMRRVQAALEAAGYVVRSDQDLMGPEFAGNFRRALNRLLTSSDLALILWSRASIDSDEVWAEAELAYKNPLPWKGARYLGVRLDPVEMGAPYNLARFVDLAQDGLDDAGLARIVQEVNARIAGFATKAGAGAAGPVPAAPVTVAEPPPVAAILPQAPSPDLAGEEREASARELEFYTDATQAGTIPALRSYLTHYPKGAHRADAEARLAALTSPVHRWRKRMIGGGAAIAGALTLLFTGYPVLKELTTSPNAVMERAAEEAPELAAAIAPEPEAPVPAPAAEQTAAPEPPAPAAAEVGPVTPPPMLALATLASPAPEADVIPPTPSPPVTPATLSTLAPPAAKADLLLASDTESFDLDLSPLIEACDLAAGSSGYAQELMALGRRPVLFIDIDPEVAVPACASAHAVAPLTPRVRHAFASSLWAAGAADPLLLVKALAIYKENCWAADKAGAPSCLALGRAYRDGSAGIPADLAKAISGFSNACELDQAWGCEEAAYLLRQDSPQKDLLYAAQMAGKGCGIEGAERQAESCNTLGLLYLEGFEGTRSNIEEALAYFQKACDLRYAWGCENAAYRMRQDGPQRDRFEAARLAEQGCEMRWSDGSAESCNTLGMMRGSGEIGEGPDVAGAITAFAQSCETGYAWGCANAAEYLREDGPQKDMDRAAQVAETGCRMEGAEGRAESCNTLGIMLGSGEMRLGPDIAGAITAFSQSCELGYAWGCANAAAALRLDSPYKDLTRAARIAEKGCGMEGAEGKPKAVRR